MYQIIRDTKEKAAGLGYKFYPSERCSGMIIRHVEVGDYTIEGFEDQVTIERKASTGELANNITEDRFTRLLQKLKKYPYKFIVCEFEWSDVLNFPYNSGIPQSKWPQLRVTNKFLQRRITEIQLMGIPVVFAGSNAGGREFVSYMLDYLYREFSGKSKPTGGSGSTPKRPRRRS